jgi:twitching motility protein PilT
VSCVQRKGSDLHLNPGRAPVLRVKGDLVSLGETPLDDAATEKLCRELCDDLHWAEVAKIGTTDFGLAHEAGNRFRVSVMRQRGRYSAVLRLIPSTLLTFEQIGLPDSVKPLLRKPRGLILVTGPTGSGKTTTLATMIDWINQSMDRHIVTIEDPIEYYHGHKKGLVTQREVGADVPSFVEAMRRVLRQDPDVVLLGEMRDLDTISSAVTAARQGHLVFGTLHTTGSARTVNRIIDAFPANQQEQIRAQLSVRSPVRRQPGASPEEGWQRTRRGVRDHDHDARDREPDPQERDEQDPLDDPDVAQARDDHARRLPARSVQARRDLARGRARRGAGRQGSGDAPVSVGTDKAQADAVCSARS